MLLGEYPLVVAVAIALACLASPAAASESTEDPVFGSDRPRVDAIAPWPTTGARHLHRRFLPRSEVEPRLSGLILAGLSYLAILVAIWAVRARHHRQVAMALVKQVSLPTETVECLPKRVSDVTAPAPPSSMLAANRTLRSLLEDAASVTAYSHPLEFVKLTLAKHDDGSKLRLHIWLGGAGNAAPTVDKTMPHTHGWGFDSRVLRGSLTNAIYTREEIGDVELFDEYEVDLTKHDARCHTRFVRKQTPLAKVSVTRLGAGEGYSQTREVVHTSQPMVAGTITLMHQEAPSGSVNYVWTRNGKVLEEAEHHAALSPDQLQVHLDHLLTSLEATGTLDQVVYGGLLPARASCGPQRQDCDQRTAAL